MGSLAPRPAPTHVIAHLSDPHLLAGDRLLSGRIDTAAQLRQALSRVEESKETFDAIVLSGDLTDSADPDAYALLLEIAQPVVDRLGAALVMTGGNHDERRPLAATLFGSDTDAPQDRVTHLRGLRLITLDSAVPGYHHGGFSDAQYNWLATELATPADFGTVLVMHHPPITYHSPTMAMLDFDDPARLGRVLAGTDVRAILSGHLHVTTFGTLSGIPVMVAGGVSYVDDVGAPRELMIGVDGPQSWNLIELHAGAEGERMGEVVASVAPVARHPGWPALSEAVRDYMSTVPADDRREVFSRKRS
ncbi:MAG: metallophosphoesterase [Humibacillus sp.]|nr:metallophosphoesterase [Humibacillus sp.]MDN5777785.1 metallophosphoesterase [Humibacillus sp.]